MIRFKCGNCGRMMNVPDEWAGRRGKCPACNTVGLVPDVEVIPELSGAAAVPQVIEQTAKKWKLAQLIAVAVLFFGFFATAGLVCIQGRHGLAYEVAFAFSVACAVCGFIGFCVVRVLTWWHHG